MFEFAFASYIDHTITFYSDNRVNKFSEDAFRRAVASLGKKGWQIVGINNGLYLQRAGLPNTASTGRAKRGGKNKSLNGKGGSKAARQ